LEDFFLIGEQTTETFPTIGTTETAKRNPELEILKPETELTQSPHPVGGLLQIADHRFVVCTLAIAS